MDFWTSFFEDIWIFFMDNFIPIFAICITIIGIFLGLKRKGFSYYIESVNAVVSVEEKVADQVEIYFDGNQVENVHLIVMNIRNSGNQSISFEDFKKSVTFYFGENVSILSVSTVETEPLSLNPEFILSDNTIELMPLLLNGGDNMTVNFLVSNMDPDALEVRGRIKGVKDIKLESEESGTSKVFLLMAVITFLLAIFLMMSTIITLLQGAYIFVFSYFLMAMSSITNRKNKKRLRVFINKIRSYIKL